MRRHLPLLWVWLLPVLLGLPFIGRAYFVDDHYHMLMARGILDSPLRPYDFRADDDGADNPGWERGQSPRMVNPPLHHYILAAFWKLSGGRLWVVRLGGLFLAGLAAILLYMLAQRLLIPPWPVTVLAALTPAFWLSSYALLIDSTMLVFFLAALLSWIDGLKDDSPPLLALSGFFMGLTILTKYTGGFIGLLALIWWGLQIKELRRWRALFFLLIPALMVAAWSAWNIVTYGEPHLLAAARRVGDGFRLPKMFVFLSFFGGALLFPLSAWGWSARGDKKLFWTGLAVAGALEAFLMSPWGGFSVTQSVLLAVFAGGGLLFFLTLFRRWNFFSLPTDKFLIAWLILGSLQMVTVMGWVAARYYVTILPPTIFLFYRFAQKLWRHAPSSLNRFQTAWGALLFCLGLSLAWADYIQAETSRRIVVDTAKDGWLRPGRRCFYLGDSFTSSYLRGAGWLPAFPRTTLLPGDLVLRQEVTMPAWWFRVEARPFSIVKTYEYSSGFPLRVMDNQGAAGFYASAWGALPFTLSESALERYQLLQVLPGPGAEKPQ